MNKSFCKDSMKKTVVNQFSKKIMEIMLRDNRSLIIEFNLYLDFACYLSLSVEH